MPNGNKWPVKIKKTLCSWYFNEGWSQFVYRNHVSNGEILVFTHVGEGLFHVKRFLFESGCSPYGDNESEFLAVQNITHAPHPSRHVSLTCVRLKTGEIPFAETDHEVDIDSSDGWFLSDSEDEPNVGPDPDIQLGADPIQPFFSTVLSTSQITSYFVIPTNFWEAHGGHVGGPQKAMLTVHYRTWDIVISKHNGKFVVHGGWKRFVRENDLMVGVRCTFRLLDDALPHFRVTFKR